MKNQMAGTLCNSYANEDREYVFCSKGRPFGCLLSPHLPTPTQNLIDYSLVREVGMKMSDLQYTKMSFAGNKFRVLGKVSVTVQTIHDGLASGNFHMKANVVLDLAKCLDVESVAGAKLSKQLEGRETYSLSANDLSSCSSSPSSTPRRSSPCCWPPSPEDTALASAEAALSPAKAKLPSWVPGAATISRYCAQAQPATESSPRD